MAKPRPKQELIQMVKGKGEGKSDEGKGKEKEHFQQKRSRLRTCRGRNGHKSATDEELDILRVHWTACFLGLFEKANRF